MWFLPPLTIGLLRPSHDMTEKVNINFKIQSAGTVDGQWIEPARYLFDFRNFSPYCSLVVVEETGVLGQKHRLTPDGIKLRAVLRDRCSQWEPSSARKAVTVVDGRWITTAI